MTRIVTLLCLLLVTGSPRAELSATEAVTLGQARTELSALATARREVAIGEAAAAGRWDNPELEYSREGVDVPGGTSEDRFLWVRQRFNLAGVHGLERQVGDRRVLAEEARIEYLLRERAREIRLLFYRALASQRLETLLGAQARRVAVLREAIAARVDEGDAARYDLLRLERESAAIEARLHRTRAEAEAARMRLFAMLDIVATPLAGELLPPPLPPTELEPDDHPLVRALAAEAAAAELAARAARRAAWPELTVGVGRRETEEPGLSADGSTLSVALEVPIFDRNRGQSQAAIARADALSAEAALTHSRMAAELRASGQAMAAQREAALAMRTDDSLAAMAEAAYAAGELSVMALIDAHQADLEAAQQRIELALAAREHWIEIQLLTGE